MKRTIKVKEVNRIDEYRLKVAKETDSALAIEVGKDIQWYPKSAFKITDGYYSLRPWFLKTITSTKSKIKARVFGYDL